ncbi:hypothetical protein JIP62_03165 [Brevundimonas vitis]|uniref:Uncharacterized protein n=1 Tax=Brevundimonas vitisensis TaxID=2800818 RepID=A0ABX7BNW4_9CAUL|nr:hypothetical protein [Brevundimonas vitisensis]QQQ19135.1 hypothetical protein JIP62_03165 [Brevundimonas vitisensis]
MTGLFLALSLLLGQTPPPASAWTWTLYDTESPVVLAHEVPDTVHLRTTLECDTGSGVARVSMYGFGPSTGYVRFAAATAVSTSEIAPAPNGTLIAPMRTDHPVFAAFVAGGRMTATVGDRQRAIEVQPAHLAKLRRFAELCAG